VKAEAGGGREEVIDCFGAIIETTQHGLSRLVYTILLHTQGSGRQRFGVQPSPLVNSQQPAGLRRITPFNRDH